jgi:serine/threonine protein kinase
MRPRDPARAKIGGARSMSPGRPASQSSFGPYEILASLDRGGAGEVYRAWDPRLEREVALKILRDRSHRDPDRIVRFVAEARAASALNHPNIVTVFDAAVGGDSPYIVSELIDGRTLRDELRGGALPLKRLLDISAQIADGLAAAHDAGIVHRDLKPENVMVTRTGRVKIVDFGLAWPGAIRSGDSMPEAEDGQTETDPGLRVGTVPYMSPEQARGAATDFRTDQFSFGLILYELALGRPAFRSALAFSRWRVGLVFPGDALMASCIAMCTIASIRPCGGPTGKVTLSASTFQSCTTSACARTTPTRVQAAARTSPASFDRIFVLLRTGRSARTRRAYERRRGEVLRKLW